MTRAHNNEAQRSCPSDFTTALKGAYLYRGAFFHLKKAKTSYSTPYLGIIIPKRFAKRAVTRNTIKRVIRASFFLKKQDIKSGFYVIRLHKEIPYCSLNQLKKTLWKELELTWEKTT